MAGYLAVLVGVINSGQPNAILIGAPPAFNSDAGTAYLIPGEPASPGPFSCLRDPAL